MHPVFLFALFVSALVASARAVEPEAERFISAKQRIVFLGDSNTYAGHYVNLVEASLLRQAPELELTILNLGLNGETCSGLSEPDHPYPRPTVHERLERVLARTKPNLVVAAYGMNDGIYHPQSPERFAAFKHGIRELTRKVAAAGARLIILSPPPFDPTPLRGTDKLVDANAGRFAWFAIYENYDDVLKDYTAWLTGELDDDRVDLILDIRTPLLEPGGKRMKDGVHYDMEGHRIVANMLLAAWNFKPEVDSESAHYKLVAERQRLLRDAWLTACGHQRPDVPPGLPLAKAQERAEALRGQIMDAVKD